jgi:hypothetical protein
LWAVKVCRYRSYFTSCALKLTYEDGVVSFVRFLGALQNPLVCCSLELEAKRAGGTAASSSDEVLLDVAPTCQHACEEHASLISWSSESEYDASTVVEVLPEVFFLVERSWV